MVNLENCKQRYGSKNGSFWLVVVLLFSLIPARDLLAADYFYQSAQTVENLQADFSGSEPSISSVWANDSLNAEDYVKPVSCLGYYSPIGAYGVLSSISPLGPHTLPGAALFEAIAEFYADFFESIPVFKVMIELTKAMVRSHPRGPLSEYGPLGSRGILNPDNWYTTYMDLSNSALNQEFVAHLQPGGVWSILGPIGPLGPLGPNGPLGPIGLRNVEGAHMFERNENGEWLAAPGIECLHDEESPEICRKLKVDWNARESRTYEMVEHYSDEFAKSFKKNDTSFLVDGILESAGDSSTYKFQSQAEQIVSVLVLPHSGAHFYDDAMRIVYTSAFASSPDARFEFPKRVPLVMGPLAIPTIYSYNYDHTSAFDDFDIELNIRFPNGKEHKIISESVDMIDWIQVRVPKGTKLAAKVKLASTWTPSQQTTYRGVTSRCFPGSVVCEPEFRLIVVGSGEKLGRAFATGPQSQALDKD